MGLFDNSDMNITYNRVVYGIYIIVAEVCRCQGQPLGYKVIICLPVRHVLKKHLLKYK